MRLRSALVVAVAAVALTGGGAALAVPSRSPAPIRVHKVAGLRSGRRVLFDLRGLRHCAVTRARLRVHGRRLVMPVAAIRQGVRRGKLRVRVRVRGRRVLLAVGCALASPLGSTTAADPAVNPGGGPIPSHTETWAYDDSSSPGWCNGGYGASSALVRQWLTYAETNCGWSPTKPFSDCHAGDVRYCTVFAYLDPNLAWPGNPVFTQHAPLQEDWWLHQPGHTDSGHRLTETGSYGTGYLLNQTVPAVRHWVQSYVRSRFDAWDGLLLDDTAGSMAAQFWGSGHASSQEIQTDAGVMGEHRQLAGMLTHSDGTPFLQVDNGINDGPGVKPTFPLLDNPRSVVGLMAESEAWDYGMQPNYATLLDDIASVDTRPRDFIVLLSYDQGGRAAARRVQEATVLLGYSPGHVVDWADLEQDNLDLAVWPEEGIYPTRPIESMGPPRGGGCLTGDGGVCSGGGHNDVQVATGVYRREFRACYDRGTPFGGCAVIVNDTSHAVTVPPSSLRQLYLHEITFDGGDVQSGGTIDTSGALFIPGVTSLAPHDALLLAR
jgi:hypothetical protein